MTLSVQFGSRTIEFKLEYSNRKSLGITVTPDLQVSVAAPVGASIEKIKEKVKKRAPWIIRQQGFFLQFHPKTPPRKYVAGETHLYMGRHYRLKVFKGKRESVNLKGRYIEITTSNKKKVEKLLKDWYAYHSKTKLFSIADPLIERFKKYKATPDTVALRNMPNRWGSCTTEGKIILNPELIKAPKGCIEYVIIHELCHLIHRNHTHKFFALQAKEMPNWEKWKMRLEKVLA